jgi:hypothetical protein
MRGFLMTLGLAGVCASGLLATGVAAAVPDGPLAMRAAISEPQDVEQAAWVCRGPPWNRRCFRTGPGRGLAPVSWRVVGLGSGYLV